MMSESDAVAVLVLDYSVNLVAASVRRPQGSMEVVCEETGEWSRPAPRCVSALCGEPPTLRDAVTVGENYEVGSKVHYVCKEG